MHAKSVLSSDKRNFFVSQTDQMIDSGNCAILCAAGHKIHFGVFQPISNSDNRKIFAGTVHDIPIVF